MNINRHNYEEFFILYMDNELGSDERRMVEAFVQQHPDLQEELDLLLQYKLVPDPAIIFSGKEELMKINGETPVTLSNYEEWLVLYMDDELTNTQKLSVDQFLAANPAIRQEFILFKQTKFSPEPLVFTNKKSLYRKEEKVRPVPFRFWRAAAAILILAAGVTTVVMVNRKSTTKEDLANIPVNQQKEQAADKRVNTPTKNETVVSRTNVNQPAENTVIVSPKQSNNPVAVQQKKEQVKELPKNILQRDIKNETVIAVNNENKTNNLPQPENNPNIGNKNDAVNSIAKNNVPKEIVDPKNLTPKNTAVTNNSANSSNIVQAAYPADNTELEPNGKKTKLRGFFRKVTRTFEKRTNIDATTDDNQLLVAGLSIKLK